MSTTDGWSKLNFASSVIRQTRSLGALVLYEYSICIVVFVNYIYDMTTLLWKSDAVVCSAWGSDETSDGSMGLRFCSAFAPPCTPVTDLNRPSK